MNLVFLSTLGSLAFGAGLSHAAAAPSGIPLNAPRIVRDHLSNMRASCLRVGGDPVPASFAASISRHDFNDDGRSDWLIREALVTCVGAVSLYAGNSGGQLAIYVARPGGGAFLAFRHGISPAGVSRRRMASGWEVYVGVGGPLCGQRVTAATPRSEMARCLRPLRWNSAQQRVDFAPLSEVIPLDAEERIGP